MRIAEIYQALQGEGFLTGTASILVRAAGCNLRCWFCDTPHASHQPEGEDLSVDNILEHIKQLGARHVVITGGEPMLFAELIPLCDRLSDCAYHVTIETAGTLYLPVVCDLISISPKLSNSTPHAAQGQNWRDRHTRTRFAPKVIRRLVREHTYQIKFVVDQPEDLHEINDYIGRFPEISRDRVMLMPQGTESSQLVAIAEWLRPYCRQHGFHYCPRRQVEWYGGVVRGT